MLCLEDLILVLGYLGSEGAREGLGRFSWTGWVAGCLFILILWEFHVTAGGLGYCVRLAGALDDRVSMTGLESWGWAKQGWRLE